MCSRAARVQNFDAQRYLKVVSGCLSVVDLFFCFMWVCCYVTEVHLIILRSIIKLSHVPFVDKFQIKIGKLGFHRRGFAILQRCSRKCTCLFSAYYATSKLNSKWQKRQHASRSVLSASLKSYFCESWSVRDVVDCHPIYRDSRYTN